jgi:hypothetical protein
VTLIDTAGGPANSGNNLCQVVLDDRAPAAIQDVAKEKAPFTGTFRPHSPLSAFVGEGGQGTWTLNVSDSTSFDIGSVRAFSLETRGFVCTP